MLLTLDVGNTNITIGVFDGDRMVGPFRITTKINRTSDEFGVVIAEILTFNNVKVSDIKACIIASVVPATMHSLTNAVIKYFNCTPIVVGVGIKTGIRIANENPKQVGADRIVDALGAYELYGGPVIVIDYGTATTYDYIDESGAFLYGVTTPGIRISARALWEDAAKLPEIEIVKPKSILARETISSMQAGLIYGQIGQTEYIIRKMIEETGAKNVKVVATGGLGKLISSETDLINIYDANLTLKGMKIIYEKNQ